MVSEVESHVVERPSTSKSKFQIWVMASLGFVFIVLLIATIVQVFTKNHAAHNESQNASKAGTPKSNVPDRFDKLLSKSNSRNAPDSGPTRVDTTHSNQDARPVFFTKGGGADLQNPELEKVRESELVSEYKEAVASGQAWNSSSFAHSLTRTSDSLGVNSLPGSPASATDSASKTQLDEQIAQAEALEKRLEAGGAAQATSAAPGADLGGLAVSTPKDEGAGDNKGADSKNDQHEGEIKLTPGTRFLAQFTSTVNSDFSGSSVTGQIMQPVYDRTGQFIVIPEGSTVNLSASSSGGANSVIQMAMSFSPSSIVRPDGSEIDISNQGITDRFGQGGVSDKVNRHIAAQVLGVTASALLSSTTSRTGTSDMEQTSYSGEIGQGLRQQGSQEANKFLSITPTKIIRAGQTFEIVLKKDLYVKPWSDIYSSYE